MSRDHAPHRTAPAARECVLHILNLSHSRDNLILLPQVSNSFPHTHTLASNYRYIYKKETIPDPSESKMADFSKNINFLFCINYPLSSYFHFLSGYLMISLSCIWKCKLNKFYSLIKKLNILKQKDNHFAKFWKKSLHSWQQHSLVPSCCSVFHLTPSSTSILHPLLVSAIFPVLCNVTRSSQWYCKWDYPHSFN